MKLDLRRNLLVDKPIQSKVISWFFWFGLLSIGTSMAGSFAFISKLISFVDDQNIGLLSQFIYESWRQTLLIGLVVNLVLLCIFFYFCSIIINKVVGPLTRIQNSLKKYEETGKFEPISLRKGDFCKELAESVNNLVKKNS